MAQRSAGFRAVAVHIGFGLKMLKGAGSPITRASTIAAATCGSSCNARRPWFLVFIGLHVLTLNNWGLHQVFQLTGWDALEDVRGVGPLSSRPGLHVDDQRNCALASPAGPLVAGNVIVMGLYLLAIWATAYHFSNGLSTTAMVWNLTRSQESEARLARFCTGFGIVLAGVGTAAWCAFTVLV